MVPVVPRLGWLTVALTLCSFPAALVVAQVDPETEAARPLDQVRRVSELSGRPIFAVAGQAT